MAYFASFVMDWEQVSEIKNSQRIKTDLFLPLN